MLRRTRLRRRPRRATLPRVFPRPFPVRPVTRPRSRYRLVPPVPTTRRPRRCLSRPIPACPCPVRTLLPRSGSPAVRRLVGVGSCSLAMVFRPVPRPSPPSASTAPMTRSPEALGVSRLPAAHGPLVPTPAVGNRRSGSCSTVMTPSLVTTSNGPGSPTPVVVARTPTCTSSRVGRATRSRAVASAAGAIRERRPARRRARPAGTGPSGSGGACGGGWAAPGSAQTTRKTGNRDTAASNA